MIICIIGCTGYLGSKISSQLYSQGHKIIGVCRKFPKNNKNFKSIFFKIIEGDITKTKFQEKIQEIKKSTPSYKILDSWGSEHEKSFKVGAFVNGELFSEGTGSSKQKAEQDAATKGLDKLK